jgi:hypothetical protein
MSDSAQDILDLLIDRLMYDERFPRMSLLAWSIMLRPLLPRISAIIDETNQETRNDLIREIVTD